MGSIDDNARIAIAHGARAAEAELIEAVLESTRFDPERGFLEAPVRVIVPSRSLREHLSSRLVEASGGLAGLTVQTLHAVVSTILDAVRSAGLETDRQSSALFGVLVRQLARGEPALRASLDGLRDGYASVEADVSDLLDAGFEPVHADAVIEQLQESPLGDSFAGSRARERESEWEGSWERACALVRVAAAAGAMRAESGIGHDSVEVVLAREWLESDPARFFPSSTIFVFGFADVTGVQTDLIEALVRRCGAQVTVDVPRDPAEPNRIDAGVAFTTRFCDRIKAACGQGDAPSASDPPGDSARRAAACVLHAPGRAAEVRAVAVRIRRLLDAGERAEGIGVVARTLDGYRASLRTHFHRLAIPFSGVGEHAGATSVTRRHSALLALLREGPRAPLDRWIDAVQRLGSEERLSLQDRADLGSAFHSIGIGRLEQVLDWDHALSGGGVEMQSATVRIDGASAERLGPDPEFLALPVRSGLRKQTEDRPPVVARRVLSKHRIGLAAAAARALLDHHEAWPQRASLAVHLQALRELVHRDLRWQTGDRAFDELERVVFGVLAQESAALAFDREDFLRLVERCIAKSSVEPIGGDGAGVAVLSATEARSRTFEHLFLIGMSRDVFPRPISEDPLLPDGLRRRMRVVLPDIPVKREGADEERYLFAQLMSSSRDVVLSCPIANENGKPIPVSPLLERLRGVTPIVVPGLLQAREPVRSQASPPSQRTLATNTELRPAHEHALLAGLYGSREQFRRALRVAVAEMEDASPQTPRQTTSLADSRVAVLAELHDRGSHSQAARLGPYYGFVGPATDRADPRRAPLFVTTAEQIAACPWQAFVNRLLRIEPVPDACAELPSADPRLVGGLVHDVLHHLAAGALLRSGADPKIDDLGRLAAQTPVRIEWPAAKDEQELLLRRAAALAEEHGIRTPGFSRVLAARAQGHMATARQSFVSASSTGPAEVIGVEVSGMVQLADRGREVHFRADRVDRPSEQHLALIDYKTGKPFATQKTADTRRAALQKRMAKGESLQAAAYAIAAQQASGEAGLGEYLYLDPNAPEHARSVPIESDAEDLIETFEHAISQVFEVIERGSFFPRLVDAASGTEPRRCSNCEVKEACIRGDTGARQRLEHWVSNAHRVLPEDLALADMWMIGVSER